MSFVYRPPTEPYLKVLYHDDDIVVVDKPSGLLSVPGRLPEHQDSLMLRILRVFPSAVVIHRLDMSTSGLMVLALNRPAMSNLARQFQERTVGKTYTAWVHGSVGNDGGLVDQPLICDWPNRPKQMVCYEHGKSAQTLWKVQKRNANQTLVTLYPITGRSHQLRVHMLYLGHVILGDQLYARGNALTGASRLQLHATTIQFTHPTTAQTVSFDSPAEHALEFLNP
ncbi:RluA family pseudouridine synthase [Echinimonas agarilytica]|uniref:Pseudouridine synthase n=1 Tax=Echinimonas agarilytica TaxID=1215918 RepID=A0AA41W9W1_9GAMM|nr:RluA family pseudouridine synthase [Echinimonas agarilytica]MCM2681286.1 RluA family pseudouridine synthase [Echinimonas agarilytica]